MNPIIQEFSMDKLSAILNRFSISAGVFYTGGLCGLSNFDDPSSNEGHLHLLSSGRLKVIDEYGHNIDVDEPSLLFYPRPTRHQLRADESNVPKVVCATIQYGTGPNNPLANALPDYIVMPLSETDLLRSSTEGLFDEAFNERSARQLMMDRLTEIFLIQLLRHVIESGELRQGALAGLAHQQLAKAMNALHEEPESNWTLEKLAALAHMSKSKFSEEFRQVVGQSPGDYIIEWRVAVAQTLLKKGKPVNWVANQVGYENASALSRVFRKKIGLSPKEWFRKN